MNERHHISDRWTPPEADGRDWLRVVEESLHARQRAALTWHALGHSGRPQCPGCRRRRELAYLEFRNWHDDARFKLPQVLAVCDRSASGFLALALRFVFGVTALDTHIGWPCRGTALALPEPPPAHEPPPSRKESRRGTNPRSLANLVPNARWRRGRPA